MTEYENKRTKLSLEKAGPSNNSENSVQPPIEETLFALLSHNHTDSM